ncbi:MAG: hypothetical protein K2Y37_25575 [Pirellulales bacterium]|nr:hypothetical protein [Pirellulales bacterium]
MASAHYQYHYDAAGRLDKSLSTLAGLTSNQAVLQTHTRDTLGRRTGLATTLGGTFSASTFSVSGGTADLANTYTYDKQSRLTRVVQTSPGNDPVATLKCRVPLLASSRRQLPPAVLMVLSVRARCCLIFLTATRRTQLRRCSIAVT